MSTGFITHPVLDEAQCDALLAWLAANRPAEDTRNTAAREAKLPEAFSLQGETDPAVAVPIELFRTWMVEVCADAGFEMTGYTWCAMRYRPGAGMERHRDDIGEEGVLSNGFGGTVQLTPSREYVGGDQVLDDGTTAPRERGVAAMTRWGVWHGVTEVTDGIRWVLAAWIHGPGARRTTPLTSPILSVPVPSGPQGP